MIKNWLITGDTHGRVTERLTNIDTTKYLPEETALLILGDAGLNFYLNKTDKKQKLAIQNSGFHIYCVRGNHEERPQNIPSYKLYWDEEVNGNVYEQDDYPNIHFLMDGHDYWINGFHCLVIGGAYSVDKWYRIAGKDTSKWTGWFKDEQLTQKEMDIITETHEGKYFDFVFTHTCPISWEPTDLFLSMVDQKSVDKSMELWLDDLKDKIEFGVWCFGHYHADQMIRPGVQMFYYSIETIEEVFDRWAKYQKTGELEEWWLRKSPMFYAK